MVVCDAYVSTGTNSLYDIKRCNSKRTDFKNTGDGGLGIRDPTIDTALEYSRSLRICQPFLTGKSAEECIEEEHSIFKSLRDEENIKICEDGIELLDSFIGSVDYVRERVVSRVSKWCVMLERLVEIALFDPQCVFLAYTFAFQYSWTRIVRICDCEERWFQPLEYIFVNKFLSALTGLEYIPPELRETISLPYWERGLALDIIGKYIGIQYERFCRVSASLGCYADINKVKEA
ncbi:hypothetical protein GJ496_007247 [Pomphorhynchus laevis]|nr:hypothetical protein GJ496_007247 [Pomphorhynchus laevis]